MGLAILKMEKLRLRGIECFIKVSPLFLEFKLV